MKKSSIKFLVFFIAIIQSICITFAQKISDEKIKELLIGNWTNGNGVVVFNKDGKFDDYSGTYQIKKLIDRDPNAKPRFASHESTGGDWYLTDSILKKRYLVADGKKLIMGKQFFETCTIQNISIDKFQCFYGNTTTTIVWEKIKPK
jgi:hypothetical protein